MTVIRILYEKRGGHYHCRVFTAPRAGETFANCGELVFDEREWPSIMAQLSRPQALPRSRAVPQDDWGAARIQGNSALEQIILCALAAHEPTGVEFIEDA